MKVYLGIDTSCYTTSVAVLDENAKLLADERQILSVKQGGCGLQQHEMVFQHVRALPILLKKVMQDGMDIAAIGVSATPRPLTDSYMPAFLVGLSVARSMAVAGKLQVIEQSHQENHLLAGLWSCGGIAQNKFLMLHASGGTTDLLLVEKQGGISYKLQTVGGSIDLHAGQFVDRVGVALGLQFPTGRELEKLANSAKDKIELPVSVHKTKVSLSGPATAALRKLQESVDKAELALGVEHCLGESFGRMLRNAAEIYQVTDVLLVGGVASNQYIRKICGGILLKCGLKMHCAEACYSCDCAVGNAYKAWLSRGM